MRGPDRRHRRAHTATAGRDDRTLVSSIDLAPTILNAAGVGPTEEMPGIDLSDRARLAERKEIHASTRVTGGHDSRDGPNTLDMPLKNPGGNQSS